MKHYTYESPFKMVDSKNREYILTVEQDEYAESPREWDNLCTMICWHRRYALGDKHQYDGADEFFEDILHTVCGIDRDDLYELTTLEKYKLAVESEKLFIKEINMYEHSGITVSTSSGYPYNDRWDSGSIGFIYATKKKILENVGNANEVNWTAIADECIENEMETYDQYLRGNVYHFRLTEKVTKQDKCPHCGEVISEYEEEEEIDSCSGFYGDCLEENGILDNISNDIKFVED